MTSTPHAAHLNPTLGDSAVDGLLAGTSAGLLMGLYVLAVGVLSGQAWTALLAQFDPSPVPSPLTGVVAHLAVAGVYGVAYAVAWRWLRRLCPPGLGWLAGLAYGLLLWGPVSRLLRLPAGGISETWLAVVAPVHLVVAHLVYGAALGWLLGRREPAPH